MHPLLLAGTMVAVLGAVSLGGCRSDVAAPDEADHEAELVRLEGESLARAFAGDGISPIYEVPGTFLRLAILWDASAEGALEVRVSGDGETWSDWTAPRVHFAEAGAYVGTVEPDGIGTAYQLRLPAGVDVLTHVAVDAVESLPESSDELDAVEAQAGYEEGDGMIDGSAADEGDVGSASAAISARGLVVHSRREWGARRPRCVTRMSPYRVTIHHTVTPTRDSLTVKQRLRQIQAYHMDGRGWCDIAYNYLISRDGRVWVGRGARRMGGHVYNQNGGNVGISFIGTYSTTRLNRAQRRNAAKLLVRLHRRFPAIRLNRRDIRGHREHGASGGGTECPGNAAYPQLDRIVRLARR